MVEAFSLKQTYFAIIILVHLVQLVNLSYNL